MRKTTFVCFLLVVLQHAFAQNYSNVTVPYNPPPPVYLRDVFTTPVEPKKYADIQGTPFLDNNWMLARLKISQYKIVDSIQVKLNLYERKLHFKNEKGEELQAAINFEQIDIIDGSSKWRNSVFLPGMANDKEAFFQVVTDGSKIKLVKKLTVNKWEIKALNAETQKKFELEEKLFLFANGELFKTNKNCSSLAQAFGNNQDVLKFTSTNDLKCNKEEDLKKLVNYFNSL
jgi:hypothetical protein